MTKAVAENRKGLRQLAERIRGRRSTNLFLKQKVSPELVRDAVELARWAPNHHLTEPWRFYVLGEQAIEAGIELIRDNAAKKKDAAYGDFKAESARAVPGWLVVTCKKSDEETLQREDYAACCCAIQNLMLYLSEAGVATKWTTGEITRDARFHRVLGSDPEQCFIVALIWFGYPKILPTQSRQPLENVLTELP